MSTSTPKPSKFTYPRKLIRVVPHKHDPSDVLVLRSPDDGFERWTKEGKFLGKSNSGENGDLDWFEQLAKHHDFKEVSYEDPAIADNDLKELRRRDAIVFLKSAVKELKAENARAKEENDHLKQEVMGLKRKLAKAEEAIRA